ncbi:hypothetical protein D3C75_1036170 [compost metagenome]
MAVIVIGALPVVDEILEGHDTVHGTDQIGVGVYSGVEDGDVDAFSGKPPLALNSCRTNGRSSNIQRYGFNLIQMYLMNTFPAAQPFQAIH